MNNRTDLSNSQVARAGDDRVAALVEALEETQGLLVAMLHETRPPEEIEAQIADNRAALLAFAAQAPAALEGDERAAFDTWARNNRLDACVSLEGHYTHAGTGYAWAAWRERASIASRPAVSEPVACKLCNSMGSETPCAYPTEINRQQAKRITELLDQIAASQPAQTERALTDEQLTELVRGIERKLGIYWFVPDDSERYLWRTINTDQQRKFARALLAAAQGVKP